MCKLSCSVPQ
nr:unnamed protein product [Callosobruchus analis]CAI5858676.1 unnamed protein product [Callosobruchus analis]